MGINKEGELIAKLEKLEQLDSSGAWFDLYSDEINIDGHINLDQARLIVEFYENRDKKAIEEVSMKVEFKAWPKIGRENPYKVTITEQIDGTNACIIINGGKVVGVQSRKRLITPEDDNYGFAKWVSDNNDELLNLGDGYHYGEWAGLGIQKNPHNLPDKRFFLFDTFRWNENNPNKPNCCEVVPILYDGILSEDVIPSLLDELKANECPLVKPEGVIVYYHAFRSYTKHTISTPDGKWFKLIIEFEKNSK